MRLGALFAATLLSFAASAQTTRSTFGQPVGPAGHFSIYSGETLAPGRDAISFDVGWPGISFGYLHGLSDRSDVRLNVEMLYGYENSDSSKFGFGLGAPFRLVIDRTDRITLGVHVDPGFRVYTGNNYTPFFLRFPVGGTLAIHATPELDLSVGVDVPFAVQLTDPAFLLVGPLFGFAVEYKVDRTVNLGLHTRFGPIFNSRYTGSTFGYQTLLGIGYRL